MKLKYIVTGNKDYCCGCRACEQTCHAAALSMKPDGEGFLYPVFDEARCVDCGLCERVCPMGDPLLPVDEPAEVYAAKSRSEKLCMSSSSGGLFSEIALHVLEKSGAVFGAAFAEDGSVRHVSIESADDLGLLRGSKYVQSDIGDCYSRVREFLKAGRWVYFVGTPCQVAGLRKFLRKEYDRLLTSDLVCHGVPSQKMFAAYKDWEERRHGGKIREFSFRNLKGWGHSKISPVFVQRVLPLLPWLHPRADESSLLLCLPLCPYRADRRPYLGGLLGRGRCVPRAGPQAWRVAPVGQYR